MLLNLSGTTNPFRVDYSPPLRLEGDYEVSLVKASVWYSWYSISPDMNNNTLKYYNGAVWRDVTIPSGNYTVEDLDAYLKLVMKSNGDYLGGSPETYYISLSANYSTIRVALTLENNYQLDLTTSDLYLLLGSDQAIYNFTGTQDFPYIANINNDINSLNIITSLVDQSFAYNNNNKAGTLYTFVPTSLVGTDIQVIPITRLYVPLSVTNGQLRSVEMLITDQLNRVIDFNGQPIDYLLHLKKISN